MCGIAGLSLNTPNSDLKSILDAMSRSLVHRGPDADGLIVNDKGSAGLAHRRLSIVDVTDHARQPFVNEDGTLAMVCNGEIYNAPELRERLLANGHTFTSNSDNEVVLHLFEDMGEGACHVLKGMFAFAILDLRSGDVFCARDPLGKKPLYYAETELGVALASEIPALRKVPWVDQSLDPQAIGLYLLRNLRHVPDPWTIYKGVRTLPPGHKMRVSRGHVVQMERFWKPKIKPQDVRPDEVLQTFDAAVKRRTMADVEIGALLSGGVDSTAIVDSLKRQGFENIRTYAFGLDANDAELERARLAAGLLGTRHREVHFDADRQHDLFDDLLRHHGQPIMALPLTHAMMLFDAIHKDGLKVVMSGHGADEVFYGYDGAANLVSFSNFDDAMPKALSRAVARILSPFMTSGSLGQALRVLKRKPGARKAGLYQDEAEQLWGGLFQTRIDPRCIQSWVKPWFTGDDNLSYIDEAAFLGLVQENAHAITIAGDLPAMARSIEVRCPFLDVDLVGAALNIPYAQKVKRTSDFSGGKLILKQALEGRLPQDILYAPKRGFGYFVQEEDVLRGPWKERVDDAFADFDDCGGLFDVLRVRDLKSRFDQNDAGVPASLIAKLYALQRFLHVAGGRA